MLVDRRTLLKLGVLLPVAHHGVAFGANERPAGKADYTLRIVTGLIELSPEHIVSTTLYNGQFPGPLLRFKEGKPAMVDLYNETDTPDLLLWHGQRVGSELDGAAEEGTQGVTPGFGNCVYRADSCGFRLQ